MSNGDGTTDPRRPLVRLAGIGKSYPGVRALDEISIEFRPGEIHSIVGENGAGKSTLVKMLAGLETPDNGEIFVDGQVANLRGPAGSRRAGISYVPQEPELVPTFTIGRNVMLGRERPWSSRSRLTATERVTVEEALARVGAAALDVDELAAGLSVAQSRLCQIAATLIHPGSLLVLDEPTAVLSDSDADVLLQRLISLRDSGTSILYVSHRLGEVMRLSDRISVLRDGRLVGTFARGEIDRPALLALMARTQSGGAPVKRRASPAQTADATPPVLTVTGLGADGAFDAVTFEVRPGEVVGVAGIQGSGHGKLLEALSGAMSSDTGEITVDGAPVARGSLHRAMQAGIRLVPEERRVRGIVAARSIRENLGIGHGSAVQRRFLRRPADERARSRAAIAGFGIRARDGEVAAGNLSGGNQQKVVIARVLGTSPRVLLLSEPTQGIDVRSKTEILTMLRDIAREQGIAVVLASCEFEELLEYTDVIHVMRLGRISASVRTGETSYAALLDAAVP